MTFLKFNIYLPDECPQKSEKGREVLLSNYLIFTQKKPQFRILLVSIFFIEKKKNEARSKHYMLKHDLCLCYNLEAD